MAPSHTAISGGGLERIERLIAPITERFGYLLPALVLVLVLLVIAYPDRVIFTAPYVKNVPLMPNRKPLPLIGHTHHIVKMGTKNQFDNIMEGSNSTPNGVWQTTMAGLGKQFMLLRPEYIEAVQKTYFEHFEKGPMFRDRFSDVLGSHGIFVADGEVWRKQRKLASWAFSAGEFRNHIQNTVHGELARVIQILDGVTAKEKAGARNNKLILPELFFRYTLSSFGKMAFSADLDCLGSSPESLEQPVPFAVAFDQAQGIINERFVDPIYFLTELVSRNGRKMREARRVLRKTGIDIIGERLEERKAQQGEKDVSLMKKKDGRDLLDLFMDVDLDVDYLYFTTMNFLIAGRDTTAQMLSWTFYELFQHPEHVDEMVKEINDVCNGGVLEYDDMKRLPYTQAVLNEALRLHPSVPKNGKVCIKDVLLQPAGNSNLPAIQFRKGEWAGWSDWVIARRTDVWGEDAAEFKPSRFLRTDETGERHFVQHDQWKFHVFNGGPRLCLGMNLANYEAMALCSALLPRYKFSWTSKQDGQIAEWPLRYQSSVTLPSEMFYSTVTRRD